MRGTARVLRCLALVALIGGCAGTKPPQLAASDDARVAVGRARALIRECKYEKAEALIRPRLVDATPEDRGPLLLMAGVLAEHQGNSRLALEQYRAATESTPTPANAYRLLGRLQIAEQNYQEGYESLAAYMVNELTKVKRLPEPTDFIILAIAAAELGRPKEAQDLLDKMSDRYPNYYALTAEIQAKVKAAAANGQQPAPGSFWSLAYETGDDRLVSDFEVRPLKRVAPVYPREALWHEQEGVVLVGVEIDETGTVTRAWVIDETPYPGVFGAVALAAVRQWRFEPAVRDCQAVPSEGVQQLEFRLTD